MTTRSELDKAGDGSIIRYRGGVCWKAEGIWHALAYRGDSEGYGAVSVWKCFAFLAEEMRMDKVELISMLPSTPPIPPKVPLSGSEYKFISEEMTRRGIPFVINDEDMP